MEIPLQALGPEPRQRSTRVSDRRRRFFLPRLGGGPTRPPPLALPQPNPSVTRSVKTRPTLTPAPSRPFTPGSFPEVGRVPYPSPDLVSRGVGSDMGFVSRRTHPFTPSVPFPTGRRYARAHSHVLLTRRIPVPVRLYVDIGPPLSAHPRTAHVGEGLRPFTSVPPV